MFRANIIILPILIGSTILIAIELPILLIALAICKKLQNFSDFKEYFLKAILLPLATIALTWILYGLLIYPREVHANMSMVSSVEIGALRNTISLEYLKEKKLIFNEDGKDDEWKKKNFHQKLIEECINVQGIHDEYKRLLDKKQDNAANNIDETVVLSKELETKIRSRLKQISKFKEFKKIYSSTESYQLVYRIAYIIRNNTKIKLEQIFKKEWLEKCNKKENKIHQDKFQKYFFDKITAGDNNKIEEKHEEAQGKTKNIMSGGQIVKYFAKVARFLVVTLLIGQVGVFFEKILEMMKDYPLFSDVLNIKDYSIIIRYSIAFAMSFAVFFFVYLAFEKVINHETQYHAVSILEKLNSDSGYVYGINKKEVQQLGMSWREKKGDGKDRELKCDKEDKESVICGRILLNLAVCPLLDNEVKDVFYIGS